MLPSRAYGESDGKTACGRARQHQRDLRVEIHLGAQRADRGDEVDHPADLGFRLVVRQSIEVEAEILDWIFEYGEIETVSKKNLLDFMKYRTDDSLGKIGLERIFHIPELDYQPMVLFEEEVFANSMDDFFAKRPVDYTKHDKSITAGDLF